MSTYLVYLIISDLLGLIELPKAINACDFIRPVKLAADNIPHAGNKNVVVIGRGATKSHVLSNSQVKNKKIRQGDFQTIPTELCSIEANLRSILADPNSVICTRSMSRIPFTGDSGRL